MIQIEMLESIFHKSRFHLKGEQIFRNFAKNKFQSGAFPSSGWSGKRHIFQDLSYPFDNSLS